MQPVKDVDVDISLRVVDDLTDIGIPRYTEMDARIAWRATDTLELSLSGFNLLHDQHPEGNPLANRRELRRGFSGGARLAF
jgi:hypothetical protein